MSKCKAIIQMFVEKPETIEDDVVKNHLDECPKCKALFVVIMKGTSKDMAEDVHELTQQERTELLTKIRRQEQLLLEKAKPQKKMFFFKPKFAVVIAGIIIIMASWISLTYFLQDEKQENQISRGIPESRKMKLLIQSDSRPRLYLEIEYFPENKSQGGT
jgi:hypothetical protein